MADSSWVVGRIEEDEAERRIVRRFTDELSGDDDLQQATKNAQKRRDSEDTLAFENKMRRYFDEGSDESLYRDFNVAEIARKELARICKDIDDEKRKSKPAYIPAVFGKQKKKTSANELMLSSSYRDFNDLQKLVENQENRWKESHGSVYGHFNRVCGSLNAHKMVFSIFPSQNVYAQVLCGSIALVVDAAVNHDEIAELLSSSVAQVLEDAGRCSNIMDIIQTQSMREQLSNIYGLVLGFFRDTLEWFMKSKASRFFDSFNSKIKIEVEKTVKTINKEIDTMYRELTTGMAAALRMIHRDTADIKAEVYRQRQVPKVPDFDAGELMQQFLKAIAHHQTVDNANALPDATMTSATVVGSITAPPKVGFTREEAVKSSKHLTDLVVGDEGFVLLSSGQLWTPTGAVTPVLQAWIANDRSNQGRTLWISSPAAHTKVSSAKAAAMNAVLASWNFNVPTISHFCERPRRGNLEQEPEETGIMGLICSLILQLLQFKMEDDQFNLDAEALQKLDGTSGSFNASLEILASLLVSTPIVSYCIIYNINGLEWGEGAHWCHSLLEVLLDHQRKNETPFNLLLATTGQSRLLPEHINNEDHCHAPMLARQVLRSG